MKYTDISVNDLESVCDCVLQKHNHKYNLARDRVVIKWDGDTPDPIANLSVTVRTNSEMKEFLNDVSNGWKDPDAGVFI